MPRPPRLLPVDKVYRAFGYASAESAKRAIRRGNFPVVTYPLTKDSQGRHGIRRFDIRCYLQRVEKGKLTKKDVKRMRRLATYRKVAVTGKALPR